MANTAFAQVLACVCSREILFLPHKFTNYPNHARHPAHNKPIKSLLSISQILRFAPLSTKQSYSQPHHAISQITQFATLTTKQMNLSLSSTFHGELNFCLSTLMCVSFFINFCRSFRLAPTKQTRLSHGIQHHKFLTSSRSEYVKLPVNLILGPTFLLPLSFHVFFNFFEFSCSPVPNLLPNVMANFLLHVCVQRCLFRLTTTPNFQLFHFIPHSTFISCLPMC